MKAIKTKEAIIIIASTPEEAKLLIEREYLKTKIKELCDRIDELVQNKKVHKH